MYGGQPGLVGGAPPPPQQQQGGGGGGGGAGVGMSAAGIYSIDVEAVATGTDHNARSVAQISLVDQREQVLLNLYVRPPVPVVSYLYPLTGLTHELLEQYGLPLEQALAILRANLPKNAVIVGQNIRKDIEWLGLKESVDYGSLVDLAGLYRIWNPQFNSYSVFGQDHVAKTLLGWDTDTPNGMSSHDAVRDAVKSVRLFNYYQRLQADPAAWQQAQSALLSVPPPPSFARQNPTFEGVCMGNRKTCSCGAAFFS